MPRTPGTSPPTISTRVNLAVESALAGGSDHFETSAQHKDGRVIPVEVYVFPAIVDGETVGIFTQARDVVALRSAEEALSINQERFRSLFEYHPDGIMELKGDGSILRVNVALESETGFFGEQMVGREWTELIAPERRDAATEALHAAMRGEAAEHESLLLDRLGNRIDVGLKLVPLRAHSEIRGAYAIFRNIEAQKSAERTIETQSDRVRRLVHGRRRARRIARRADRRDVSARARALRLRLRVRDPRSKPGRVVVRSAAGRGTIAKRRNLFGRRRATRGVALVFLRCRSTFSTKRTASWFSRAARRVARTWRGRTAISCSSSGFSSPARWSAPSRASVSNSWHSTMR